MSRTVVTTQVFRLKAKILRPIYLGSDGQRLQEGPRCVHGRTQSTCRVRCYQAVVGTECLGHRSGGGAVAVLSAGGYAAVSHAGPVRDDVDQAAGSDRHRRSKCALYWIARDGPRHHVDGTGLRSYEAGGWMPSSFMDVVFALYYTLFMGKTGVMMAGSRWRWERLQDCSVWPGPPSSSQ